MSNELKQLAAIAALDEIQEGMVVGLGTGSTAAPFIRRLGDRVQAGLRIVAIPTSEESRRLAEEKGIPLTSLGAHPQIDVTVDGADEVSPELELIKGLGGALVREKIVAHASKRVVIVVDESKLVHKLGTKTGVPIEVVPFAVDVVTFRLKAIGGIPQLRQRDNRTFVTGEIDRPADLEKQLKGITGVVDSGLFCGVAELVIVAGAGGVRRMARKQTI